MLFTLTIVYVTNGITRQQALNILAMEDDKNVTRALMGIAQQQAQVRFMTEVDPKADIRDVVINNISYLGFMTPEEFHKGFAVPNVPSPENNEQEAPATEAPDEPAPDQPAGAGIVRDDDIPAVLRAPGTDHD